MRPWQERVYLIHNHVYLLDTVMIHLTQRELSEKDNTILAKLVDWVYEATFIKESPDEFELCVDNGLPEKWSMLKDMDLVHEV